MAAVSQVQDTCAAQHGEKLDFVELFVNWSIYAFCILYCFIALYCFMLQFENGSILLSKTHKPLKPIFLIFKAIKVLVSSLKHQIDQVTPCSIDICLFFNEVLCSFMEERNSGNASCCHAHVKLLTNHQDLTTMDSS